MKHIVLLLVVAAIGVGCDRTPGGPSPFFGATAVTSLFPSTGPADQAVAVQIFGRGFRSGATVSFISVGDATNVTVVSDTVITAVTPANAEGGAVDVVVANLDGKTGRLPGGFTYHPLAIGSVTPNVGLSGDIVRIFGTGFVLGATVTFDGIDARVLAVTSTVINVELPAHATGSVDVTVRNPNGRQTSLTAAFSYVTVTLSVSSYMVAPGAQLTVTWVAPPGRPTLDWISIFRVGDPNEIYGDYVYTNGAVSGTRTFTAPERPGQYEFRCLADDGFVVVGRSAVITIGGTS